MSDRFVAPFPWFGGKRRVAPLVWERFGEVANYVEPFFGSGAVLFGRPNWQPGVTWTETANDADGFVCNVWRAITADPEQVAHWADQLIHECDLHARHAWLRARRETLSAHMEGDPDFFDAKIAGWWLWGIANWIGGGWCGPGSAGPWQVVDGQLVCVNGSKDGAWRPRVHLGDAGPGVKRQLVHLGDAGRGVKRQLVHLGDAGQGVKRQLVHLGNAGRGEAGTGEAGLLAWMEALSLRLARVRFCCGDWSRVCGPSVTTKLGLTGLLFDPPYSHAERDAELYNHETDCTAEVLAWCLEHGDNPLLRIALCGYDGEHNALEDAGWSVVAWKAPGGYGSRSDKRGRANAGRERIWFSPHCLAPCEQQPGLFDEENAR